MDPLDLIEATPWRRVAFTTYALSLSFFEAVILDRLVRGGGRNALILADPTGIRAGLSELGARRAGLEYELEPIACSTGVFHPKLSVFSSQDDCHLLVGSGNLTFGGWGVNLELVEHLHPSFAADAFSDASAFFELLTVADRVRMGAADECIEIAEELAGAISGSTRTGDIRLLHNLEGSILDQVAGFAAELGGAERVTVVSPYFDLGGVAVDRLAQQLECDRVSVHVHPSGPVRSGILAWPSTSQADPVCVDLFSGDARRLHGKAFEVMCRRGRLLVSGSANATWAALGTGNIEACIARVQREVSVGWRSVPSNAPPPTALSSEDRQDEEATAVGILRAEVDGERLLGMTIIPRLSGPAQLSYRGPLGLRPIGEVLVDDDGCFEATFPALETRLWSGGRLTLRLEQGQHVLEGFVSIGSAIEMMRRVGALGPRLMAMLAGSETPADVAEILTWLQEDYRRLGSAPDVAGAASGSSERQPIFVPTALLHQPIGATGEERPITSSKREQAWQRAWAKVLAAFAEHRGPWAIGTEQDDRADDEEGKETEEAREKRLIGEEQSKRAGLAAFSQILDAMLQPGNDGRHAPTGFVLCHYIVDRNRPAPATVSAWLQRILTNYKSLDPVIDAAAITSTLLLFASDGREAAPVRARRFLLRRQVDLSNLRLKPEAIPGFISVLHPGWNAEAFLAETQSARTTGEQVQAYLAAAQGGGSRDDFPLLKQSPEWPRLAKALDDAALLQRLAIFERYPSACPRCSITLPEAKREELRSFGVARCCRIILSTEV